MRYFSNRRVKLLLLVAGPLVLLAIVVERWSWRPRELITVDATIWNLARSPDGTMLAVGASDNRVDVWDISTRTRLKTLNFLSANAIESMAFTPAGERLILAAQITSGGPGIASWNLETGKGKVAAGRDRGTSRHIIFAQGAASFSVVSEAGSYEYDARNLKLLRTTPTPFPKGTVAFRALYRNRGSDDAGRAMAISPDRSLFAVETMPGLIALWRQDGYRPYRLIEIASDVVTALAFSPDGNSVMAACSEGRVLQWRVR